MQRLKNMAKKELVELLLEARATADGPNQDWLLGSFKTKNRIQTLAFREKYGLSCFVLIKQIFFTSPCSKC